MKIVLIIFCLTIISQGALAANCETLKREAVSVQRAQSNLKNDKDKALATLQVEYDRLMAQLSMNKGIRDLRDSYIEKTKELTKAKEKKINEIRDALENKMRTVEDMGVMLLMIDDVLRKSKDYDDINLDNITYQNPNSGSEAKADDFIRKIAAICMDQDPSKIMLCEGLDPADLGATRRNLNRKYGKQIKTFFKAYAHDDIDSQTREDDLNKFKASLKNGIPELETEGTFFSTMELLDLNIADENIKKELNLYAVAKETTSLKKEINSGPLYQDLIACAKDGFTRERECQDNAQQLVNSIDKYVDIKTKKLVHAQNFTHDINEIFNPEKEALLEIFAKDQKPNIKDLLTEGQHNSLRDGLRKNYELAATHNRFAGNDGSIEDELKLLNTNPEQGHLKLYFQRLVGSGLCEKSTSLGDYNGNEDEFFQNEFAMCLGKLALNDEFDPEALIKKTKEKLADTKEKIDKIKEQKKFKELERFKKALLEEASSVCEKDVFEFSKDRVKVCTDSYLEGCMSNNMNSIEFLGEVIAEVEDQLDPFRGLNRSNRHDRIESFCKEEDLKQLAPGSCTNIATRNEITRQYSNYINGNPAQGTKKSFGNLFNTALSRELPGITNTFMYLNFQQPMYYDNLYYNAIYQKQMVHYQDQWSNIQYDWMNMNGWTNDAWNFDYYYNNL